MEEPTQADHKALAMSYAYTALVRALVHSGSLSMDALMANLAGATQQLERIGESDAAFYLGEFSTTLLRID